MSEMNAVYNVKQYILNLIKQNKLEYGDQLQVIYQLPEN